MNKRKVPERVYEVDILRRLFSEDEINSLADPRIEMNGENYLHISEILCNPPYGSQDIAHRLPKALPPVHGHDNYLLPFIIEGIKKIVLENIVLTEAHQQGINHRVPCDEDPFGRNPFPLQTPGRQ